MPYILLQAVFLPLLLSPVAYLLGRKLGPNTSVWFSFGLLLYCTAIIILPVFSGTYEEHYRWTQLFGEFGLLLDGLASPFAIIIYVVSTVVALFSKPYMVARITSQFEERMNSQKQLIGGGTTMIESSSLKNYVNNQIGAYFALFLVMAMGMLGAVLATNLIEFYVFFEVMLIPAFFMIALFLNLWGLVTMIYGGLMALIQDDIKKLFAYSSISQMGYIIFGIGSASALGLSGAEMMFVSHSLGKVLLFMMVGAIVLQVGTTSITKTGGLAGKIPITAVCATIGAFTIMGVPPTSGFMAEWTMFYGALQTAIQQGSIIRMVAFGLGLVATVITMAYVLWMIKRVFFGKLPENLENTKEANWYVTGPMVVLAAFTSVIGIYADIFFNQIIRII